MMSFIKQFSHYDYLNEDNFIEEISAGNVSAQIKKYQENIKYTGYEINPSNYIRCDVPENKFLPFIDFFLSTHLSYLTNRENYYQSGKIILKLNPFFIKKLRNLFESLNADLVTDDGWLNFIRLLIKANTKQCYR